MAPSSPPLRLLMTLWPIGIVFLHFSIFRFSDFTITIAVPICTFLAGYLCFKLQFKPVHLVIAVLLAGWVLLQGIFAEDKAEFLKSYALFLNLSLVFVISCGMLLPSERVTLKSVNLFLNLSLLAAAYIILQALALNIFNSDLLNNPFGPFSHLGPGYDVYQPHPLAMSKRPNGFFSEPSAAAWAMTFSCAVALSHPTIGEKTRWWTASICGLAVLATMSLSGFINVLLLIATYSFLNAGISRRKILVLLLSSGLIIAAGVLSSASGIPRRLSNIYEPGSSAYYRITAPAKLVSESLREHPFGHPLGQVSYIRGKHYMLNWGKGSQTNIDNSFMMVTFYFGWLGLIGTIFTFGYLFSLVAKRRPDALIVLSVVLIMLETGAFWSHGVVLIIGYSIILVRFSVSRNGPNPHTPPNHLSRRKHLIA